MAQKIVKIFLDPDTIFRLKNRAGTEGRSTSECARRLLESGLEDRSGSGPDPLERPSTTSPEDNVPTLVRELLSSGLGELKAEIRDLRAVNDMNLGVDGTRIRESLEEILHEKRGDLPGMPGHQSFHQALLARKGVLLVGMTGLFLGMAIFAGCGWFLFQKGEENGIARSTSMMLTIDSLLKCEAPGWKIRTTKEGRVCYPYSAKDGLHGWRLP